MRLAVVSDIVQLCVELSTTHVYLSAAQVVLTMQRNVVFAPALRSFSPCTRTDIGAKKREEDLKR